jgi:hypothetical protein
MGTVLSLWDGNSGSFSNAKLTDLQVPSTGEWNAKMFDSHQNFWERFNINFCISVSAPTLTANGYDIPAYEVIAGGFRVKATVTESLAVPFASLETGKKYLAYVSPSGTLGYAELSTLPNLSSNPAPLFVFNIDNTDIVYVKLFVKENAIVNGNLVTAGGGATYTAGDAIDLTDDVVDVLYDNSTLKLDESNTLYVDLDVISAGITTLDGGAIE